MKRLYVFAGPNGSGKSTLVKNFYSVRSEDIVHFINADVISKTQLRFIEDEDERNLKAAMYAQGLRRKWLNEERTFAYETVFSTERHLEFMKEAKNEGYFVSTYYVATDNADLNVERVKRRVEEGGHDVPEDKIRTRFERCMRLVPEIVETSDFFVLIDNTNKFELVILKHDGKCYVVCDAETELDFLKLLGGNEFVLTTLDEIKKLAPFELEGFELLFDKTQKI